MLAGPCMSGTGRRKRTLATIWLATTASRGPQHRGRRVRQHDRQQRRGSGRRRASRCIRRSSHVRIVNNTMANNDSTGDPPVRGVHHGRARTQSAPQSAGMVSYAHSGHASPARSAGSPAIDDLRVRSPNPSPFAEQHHLAQPAVLLRSSPTRPAVHALATHVVSPDLRAAPGPQRGTHLAVIGVAGPVYDDRATASSRIRPACDGTSSNLTGGSGLPSSSRSTSTSGDGTAVGAARAGGHDRHSGAGGVRRGRQLHPRRAMGR